MNRSFPLALALAIGVPTSLPAETPKIVATTIHQPGTLTGEVSIRGGTYRYQAEVGEIPIHDDRGGVLATMSYTSYVVPDRRSAARPVTFLFNGGPLVATIALREGVGPIRTAPGTQRGEYRYEANPDSLLDQSDLVFIDAPGTGYGRFLTQDAKAKVWGVEQDLGAFAQFVQQWLSANGRQEAPVYLMGESYGGLRAALLATTLEGKVPLQGVVLVSPAFSAGEIGMFGGIDPAVLNLPTQAAIARFHELGAYRHLTIEEVAAKAETFASGRYADALRHRSALTTRETRALALELAAFTGLSADAIIKSGLRIEGFADALIPGDRVGNEDGRARAPLAEVASLPPPFDQPDSSMARDTYDRTAALDSLFRYGFRYRPENSFVYLSLEANRQWDMKVTGGSVLAPSALKALANRSQRFRVFLMGGYFDAAAPYGGPLAGYNAAKLPRNRFTQRAYEAGHAIFSDQYARVAASDELRRWYAAGAYP
ncbi:MAG TPA: alpha/beta hydrolase [Sphingobium sp.]|uniref:S10 family serine carboxypeptidase-like protein n=1 Tax=Sphingobium sp. TaxID=1912891 RepID=UPI002ED17849